MLTYVAVLERFLAAAAQVANRDCYTYSKVYSQDADPPLSPFNAANAGRNHLNEYE